jgi:trigger factor
MKIDVEQVATCVRRLTIEIPADRVNRELERVYTNLQRRVKIPGFRPGKIPRRLLENQYRPSVEHEVIQKLIPEALSEAFVKESLRSVGEPHIDNVTLTKDQPLCFVATTQVIPTFTVGDYHTWQFERRIPAVLDADVERAVERLRERHAALETVTGRPVQPGDFVIIDYKGFRLGRPLSQAAGTNTLVEVGAERFLAEIEQGLLGMVQGEEKTIPVQFSEDFRDATMAGKVVEFQVRVSEIKKKVLPEVDDDFARASENVETMAALREQLRGELEKVMRQQADEVLQRDILTKLVAENPIDVPDVLVDEQILRLYLRHKRQETGRELTAADYPPDLDSVRATFAAPALEAVRGQLLLHHIGEEAGITVAPEELEAEITALASRAAQNPEALKQAMERNGSLQAFEANLRERKIFEKILANVQITDKIVSEETTASEAESVRDIVPEGRG